jgi:TolA-binding protein
VRVQHHDDTQWTFLAGPYEVRVLGTAFDLAWQSERFELEMHEGRVRVIGPDQQEWVLEKGDALVVPPPEEPAPPSVTAAEPVETERATSLETPEPSNAAEVREVATTAGSSGAKTGGNWNQLLKEGRFAEIVSEARQLGVKRALKQRSIGDVEALGQAARYTGDGGLAEDCWKAIRGRSPGSPSARQSAFFLGRVMEQQGRRSDAIQWFARYREESPGGVFAGQALGRQLVLTSGQGRSDAARTLARDYLARYPSGPYAKAARGVLVEKSQGSGASGRNDALSAE